MIFFILHMEIVVCLAQKDKDSGTSTLSNLPIGNIQPIYNAFDKSEGNLDMLIAAINSARSDKKLRKRQRFTVENLYDHIDKVLESNIDLYKDLLGDNIKIDEKTKETEEKLAAKIKKEEQRRCAKHKTDEKIRLLKEKRDEEKKLEKQKKDENRRIIATKLAHVADQRILDLDVMNEQQSEILAFRRTQQGIELSRISEKQMEFIKKFAKEHVEELASLAKQQMQDLEVGAKDRIIALELLAKTHRDEISCLGVSQHEELTKIAKDNLHKLTPMAEKHAKISSSIVAEKLQELKSKGESKINGLTRMADAHRAKLEHFCNEKNRARVSKQQQEFLTSITEQQSMRLENIIKQKTERLILITEQQTKELENIKNKSIDEMKSMNNESRSFILDALKEKIANVELAVNQNNIQLENMSQEQTMRLKIIIDKQSVELSDLAKIQMNKLSRETVEEFEQVADKLMKDLGTMSDDHKNDLNRISGEQLVLLEEIDKLKTIELYNIFETESHLITQEVNDLVKICMNRIKDFKITARNQEKYLCRIADEKMNNLKFIAKQQSEELSPVFEQQMAHLNYISEYNINNLEEIVQKQRNILKNKFNQHVSKLSQNKDHSNILTYFSEDLTNRWILIGKKRMKYLEQIARKQEECLLRIINEKTMESENKVFYSYNANQEITEQQYNSPSHSSKIPFNIVVYHYPYVCNDGSLRIFEDTYISCIDKHKYTNKTNIYVTCTEEQFDFSLSIPEQQLTYVEDYIDNFSYKNSDGKLEKLTHDCLKFIKATGIIDKVQENQSKIYLTATGERCDYSNLSPERQIKYIRNNIGLFSRINSSNLLVPLQINDPLLFSAENEDYTQANDQHESLQSTDKNEIPVFYTLQSDNQSFAYNQCSYAHQTGEDIPQQPSFDNIQIYNTNFVQFSYLNQNMIQSY